MSNPAALAAIPAQIAAVPKAVDANPPATAMAKGTWDLLACHLEVAEDLARALAKPDPSEAATDHASCSGGQIEPLVPRWPGHDSRLPPGDPHPVHR